VLPNGTGQVFVLVTNSIFDANATGVTVSSTNAASPAFANLDNVTIMGNSPFAATTGIVDNGSQSSLVLNNSTVVRNQTGLNETNGGTIFSFGNNRVEQNVANGAPNGGPRVFE
jgi:hypothetical protein